MTAAVTMKAPAPGGLSNKARELMEAINAEAGKHNVWVRTRANAPAQRPWFSQTSGEGSGQSRLRRRRRPDEGRSHIWRWRSTAYLHQISEIARKADVSPIEFADRQSILLLVQAERTAAGHQHHPLRDLGLQSGRRRAGSRYAQRQPPPSCPTRGLHGGRGRALHRYPRRPDPDAERHLARPRQRCRRAGDLDRHPRLAADGVPRRRPGSITTCRARRATPMSSR